MRGQTDESAATTTTAAYMSIECFTLASSCAGSTGDDDEKTSDGCEKKTKHTPARSVTMQYGRLCTVNTQKSRLSAELRSFFFFFPYRFPFRKTSRERRRRFPSPALQTAAAVAARRTACTIVVLTAAVTWKIDLQTLSLPGSLVLFMRHAPCRRPRRALILNIHTYTVYHLHTHTHTATAVWPYVCIMCIHYNGVIIFGTEWAVKKTNLVGSESDVWRRTRINHFAIIADDVCVQAHSQDVFASKKYRHVPAAAANF